MNVYIFLILCGLIGIVIYLFYKLKEQKAYYAYKSDKLTNIEESSERKIEELEKAVDKLSMAAYTDITTKIGNRDYFIKKTIEMIERDPKSPYTLIGFRVANIETINHMYGSSEGDRLIRYVAGRIKKHTLKGSIYALIQTNLFGILIKDDDDTLILDLVNKISQDIENCSDIFQVKLAFGIYRIKDCSEKVSEMLSRMVLALQSVTEENKLNYAYFDEEMNRKYEENQKMCQEMEQALEDKKFVMYLQPMVDLHMYQIYSAEALVRWEHEKKGLLSPYAFLPVFENTNLMLKLDYYMWEEACKTIRRWIDNKLDPIPLMVNISPIHLGDTSFITVLNNLILRYKLQNNNLVLEIPEWALTSGGTDMLETVKALDKSGYILCIDNFGGLHSPVNLLRDLPFSMVKLDRRFLVDNSKNEEGQTILRYLIAMAKELDLTVVTEGVETLEQVNFLTEIGCDIAQGYYFSKPVSLRDFDTLNKKISRLGFRPTEYYPTFTDIDNGVDIMDKMLSRKR